MPLRQMQSALRASACKCRASSSNKCKREKKRASEREGHIVRLGLSVDKSALLTRPRPLSPLSLLVRIYICSSSDQHQMRQQKTKKKDTATPKDTELRARPLAVVFASSLDTCGSCCVVVDPFLQIPSGIVCGFNSLLCFPMSWKRITIC